MVKKILSYFSFLLIIPLLVSCSGNDKNSQLYLLTWGDYISEDIINEFEDKYQVEVIISDVESNEAMYEQIRNNRTSYDIAIPSDYMIEQLEQEDLIKKIDFSNLKNYKKSNYYPLVFEKGPKSDNYIPYFNGTLGLMYNTKTYPNIEEIVKKNGWMSLFDDKLLPDAKIGMYNSSRDAFASALLALGLDINTTNQKDLDKAFDLLKQANFEMYGDDNLKKNVVTGNLDLALVYSGDFFEELIVAEDENKQINFNYFAPTYNNYWVDGMVVPIHSKNTELAYTFIDYFLEKQNALENAEYVGYPSPLKSVMQGLSKDSDYDFLTHNLYYNPATIKGLNAHSFDFLGLDYMINLEEMFVKTKRK